MIVSPPATAYSIKHGTYAGNDADNRAIPHSCNSIPTAVIICNYTDGTWCMMHVDNSTHQNKTNGVDTSTTTAMDATNFYVGESASAHQWNASGKTYFWIAFK